MVCVSLVVLCGNEAHDRQCCSEVNDEYIYIRQTPKAVTANASKEYFPTTPHS